MKDENGLCAPNEGACLNVLCILVCDQFFSQRAFFLEVPGEDQRVL